MVHLKPATSGLDKVVHIPIIINLMLVRGVYKLRHIVQLEKCKIRVFRSQNFEVDKYCVREYTVKNLGRVSHRVGLM